MFFVISFTYVLIINGGINSIGFHWYFIGDEYTGLLSGKSRFREKLVIECLIMKFTNITHLFDNF